MAQVIAEVSKHAEMPLDWTRSASDNGVDSLALLVFRELLELRFDIHISDEESIRLDTLDDIVRHVERARGAVAPRARPVPTARSPAAAWVLRAAPGRRENAGHG